MERRETVSVDISDIEDCIKKKIYEKYPYLKDKGVIKLHLASNTKFLLFNVVRTIDVPEDYKVEGIRQ